MELSVNGRQRRAAQISKPAAPSAEKKPAGTGTALRRAGSDQATWSREALAFLQELNRQDMEKRQKEQEAKQQNSGELKMLSKYLKIMDKCQKIASRIIRGDKVPPQDERYLMESDPEGYKLAIACRVPKEKPKEWDSVLEEEEEGSTESAGPSAETAGAAEGGGESSEAVQ